MIRTFTDAYGITYTDTNIYVNYASKHTTQVDGINITTDYAITSNPATVRISYTMCYWANQQAKDDGLQNFTFQVPTQGQTTNTSVWYFDWSSDYEGLSIQDACEKHFRNFVFPEGQPAGQYNPTILI